MDIVEVRRIKTEVVRFLLYDVCYFLVLLACSTADEFVVVVVVVEIQVVGYGQGISPKFKELRELKPYSFCMTYVVFSLSYYSCGFDCGGYPGSQV